MGNDNLPNDDQNPSTLSSQPPETLQTPSAPADVSGQKPTLDAAELTKRIEAAEQRAARAEEHARAVQAAKDREIAETRKEMKTRLAKERDANLQLFQQAGVDPTQLQAVRENATRDDEMDDLREQAARAGAYDAQAMAQSEVQRYIAEQCQNAGIALNDPHLNLANKQAFDVSLIKAVREDAMKATKKPAETPLPEDEEQARRKALAKDFEPLGGMSGSASKGSSALQRELQDKLKELRGTGQVAEANRLIREYEAKMQK